jgi:hypothetical protein
MMNRLQYLLNKLAEEAGEIVQIANKTSQFGLHEVYNDGKNQLSNRERCLEEIHDLFGIVHMLNEEFDLGFVITPQKLIDKKNKTNKFYQYSKELGMVRDE